MGGLAGWRQGGERMEVKQREITGIWKEGKGKNREKKVQFNFPSASVCGVAASKDAEEQGGAQQAGGHLRSTLVLHPSATLLDLNLQCGRH